MVPALLGAPLSQVLFQSITFKTSNQTLCSASGPSFLHLTSLHMSGKWDVSLLSREGRNWCRWILTSHLLQTHIVSYWILNTKQIQLMLCSKIAVDTIFIVCLFQSGKIHHDNHSLIFNAIHIWLQTQSKDCTYAQLVTWDIDNDMLPIVQDYENLFPAWNSSGFSKSWETMLDISEKGDFLKWVATCALKGFLIF